MKKSKITDNELKIDINNLKSEVSKTNISYDNLNNSITELAILHSKSRFYLGIFLISLTTIFFAPVPIIPALVSLLAFFKRNKINKTISELKEEVNNQYQKIYLEESNIILKTSEIEFKETILDYRNGEKISESKINNLNVFLPMFPDFEYEIKRINNEYNYIHNPKTAVAIGDDWIFIPVNEKSDNEIEKIKEKILKGDRYGK